MRAVVYTRTSTTRQQHSRQINEIRALKQYTITKVFTESISGFTKSVDERPQLQEAIKYLKDKKISTLLVHEISRLGRRTTEVLQLLDHLKSHDIKIYVHSLGITVNDVGFNESVNKLIITLMTDLARMESEQLSYRIKSGLQERKRKGLTIGRKLGSVEPADKVMAKYWNVVRHLKRGESIRWVAAKCQLSPTTVQKVKRLINGDPCHS